MATPEAGWYPDPERADGIRWFDGTSWTDHRASVPGANGADEAPDTEPEAPETAPGRGTGRPTGDATAAEPPAATPEPGPSASPFGGAATERPVWASAPTAGPTTASSGPTWSPPPTAGGGWGTAPAGGASNSASRRGGCAVGGGIAVVLLIVAVIGVIAALSGDGDEVPEGVEEVAGTDLELGQSARGRVGDGGTWTARLSLAEDAEVAIDVRSTDGFDPTVRVLDADGRVVAENDDRSSMADTYGGRRLDPLVELSLAAGDHTIEVAGYSGRPGAFTASAISSLDDGGSGNGSFGIRDSAFPAPPDISPPDISPPDVPTTPDVASPADVGDGEVVDGGPLVLGAADTASVAPSGAYRAELELDRAGTLAIDAVAIGTDFDPVVTVLDTDGARLGRNDDRGVVSGQLEGRSLDPYLELTLEPGTYVVEVTGWRASEGQAELLATLLD